MYYETQVFWWPGPIFTWACLIMAFLPFLCRTVSTQPLQLMRHWEFSSYCCWKTQVEHLSSEIGKSLNSLAHGSTCSAWSTQPTPLPSSHQERRKPSKLLHMSLNYFLLPLLYLCPWDCTLEQVLVCSPVLHWWRGGCARTPPPPCDVLHQRRVDRGFHGDHQYQQRHQHGADRDQDVEDHDVGCHYGVGGGFLGNNVSHQRGGVEKDQGWWIKTWQPQSLWSPWLWKVLPWINILATPDDHVLHPPDNLPVPMLVNHCSVPKSKKNTNWLSTCWKYTTSNITYVMGLPSMEPSVLPNHFISLGLVTPVAQHRRVPTGHKFALKYNYEFW